MIINSELINGKKELKETENKLMKMIAIEIASILTDTF